MFYRLFFFHSTGNVVLLWLSGFWFVFGLVCFFVFWVFFVKKQIVELFYSFFEQLLVLKGKCIGEEVNFLLATSAVS